MLLIILFSLPWITVRWYLSSAAFPFVPQSVLKAFIMLEWFRFHVSKLNVRNILFVRECTHSLLTSSFSNAMLCDHKIRICTWKIRFNVILTSGTIWIKEILYSLLSMRRDASWLSVLYCIIISIWLRYFWLDNQLHELYTECHRV